MEPLYRGHIGTLETVYIEVVHNSEGVLVRGRTSVLLSLYVLNDSLQASKALGEGGKSYGLDDDSDEDMVQTLLELDYDTFVDEEVIDEFGDFKGVLEGKYSILSSVLKDSSETPSPQYNSICTRG